MYLDEKPNGYFDDDSRPLGDRIELPHLATAIFAIAIVVLMLLVADLGLALSRRS